jgi:N-acetylmuramoyl-L-alanine amidase
MKLLIDPGHGGHDPGAVGPAGLRESDVALAVGLMLGGHILRDDWEIVYSRMTDIFIGLDERCNMANEWPMDIFLSIHCNAAEASIANGFEVWTSPGWTEADPIATTIWGCLKETFPDMRARLDTSDGDPDKEAHFRVLTGTDMPAVLVELGFISNPAEEERLMSIQFQVAAARALALALIGGTDGCG